jgi:hypothetical protein
MPQFTSNIDKISRLEQLSAFATEPSTQSYFLEVKQTFKLHYFLRKDIFSTVSQPELC